jgi:polyisoprenoid-binding protein YceI
MLSGLLLLSVSALPAPPPVPPDTVAWAIDVNHSEVSFRVRHFVTRVPGTFRTWKGTIVADPGNLAAGRVEVEIEAASIDTRNDRRDAHLRSPDFFAVDSFPALRFRSTAVEVNGSEVRVAGDLTIRGVTRPVVLTGEFTGVFGPPRPREQRIGFSASTRINRLDYGLRWNRLVEGVNMLGDDVDITINIEAVRTTSP